MNINTLLGTLAAAISTDEDISSWCETTYEQSHKVFVNFDKRNPPSATDCPFVVLYPVHKTAGMGTSVKRHTFEIDCCLYDESTRTTGAVLEYNAVRRIETFRKLVEDSIAAADIGGALIETVEIEFDVIEQFPYAWAGMIIDINETWTTGSDPLE